MKQKSPSCFEGLWLKSILYYYNLSIALRQHTKCLIAVTHRHTFESPCYIYFMVFHNLDCNVIENDQCVKRYRKIL